MPRKPKIQESKPYESIRGFWETAYVSQFLRLFQFKLDFPSINTQELEDAIVDGNSLLVADVCARLLRYLTNRNDILISNYEGHFRLLLVENRLDDHPLQQASSRWSDLKAEDKLSLIIWLVDHVYQVKEKDLMEYLDETCSPDEMRGICAGQDAFNNLYWYLDDLRLYRENSVKKANRKDWECVCLSLSDWHSFLKQFRKTTNSHERELYSYLRDELFPLIEGQLKCLNDNSPRLIDYENKQLLFKECEELRKMIMDNKDKRELPTNSAAAMKVENKDESNSPFPEKEVSPNVQSSIVKVKCQIENVSSAGESTSVDSGMKVTATTCSSASTSLVTSASATVSIDKKHEISPGMTPSMEANSAPLTNTLSVHGQKTITSISSGGVVTAGTRTGELPCEVDTNSLPEDSSTAGKDALVLIKEENMSATPVSIKDEKPNMTHMIQNSASMTPLIQHGSNIGPMQQQEALMTNTIHKQPSMEAQYMQQQSQIFVFSTQLANKAAELVLQGHFPSIIAYHCAQPGTKRFLEKHPLKVQQFNRQNPALWLNTLAQMKQNHGRGGPSGCNQAKSGLMMQNAASTTMYGCMGSGDHLSHPNTGHNPSWLMNSMDVHLHGSNLGEMGNVPQNVETVMWPGGTQQSCGNTMYNPNRSHAGNPMEPSNCGPRAGGVQQQHLQPHFPMNPGQAEQQGMGSRQPQFQGMHRQLAPNMLNASQLAGLGQPTLTGVKVPDENLTPQQRQHREEQLAIIRNMHQMLFPDQHQESVPGDCSGNLDLNHGLIPDQGHPEMILAQPTGAGVPPHLQQQHNHNHQNQCDGAMILQLGQPNIIMNQDNCGPSSNLEQQHSVSGNSMFPNNLPIGMLPGPGSDMCSIGFCGGNGPMTLQQPRMMSGQTGVSPASMAAQMEWHKLQHQFYEERRRKHQPHFPHNQSMRPLATGTSGPIHPGFPVACPNQSPAVSLGAGNQMRPGSTDGGSGPSSAGLPSSGPGTPTPRVPGPPPPYHQASRNSNPGSVGIGGLMQSPTSPSPNPNSSSLSLPSPRMSSELSSPTDATARPFSATGNPRLPQLSPGSLQNTPMSSPNPRPLIPSNPSTPASLGAPLPSPGMMHKKSQDGNSSLPLSSMDFSPSAPAISMPPASTTSHPHPAAEGMFGRTLQSYAQSQQRLQQQQLQQPRTEQSSSPKEPNLMPVPSPQQIQYLNTFDGQELTIQKQPNTSLQDPSLLMPEGIATSAPTSKDGPAPISRMSLLSSHSECNEPLTQHQVHKPLTSVGQMHMELMEEAYQGPSSQASVDKFQGDSSTQPHRIAVDMDQNPHYLPTSTQSITPGLVISSTDASAQRFTNRVGEESLRFVEPRQIEGGLHQSKVSSPVEAAQHQQIQHRFQGMRHGKPHVPDAVCVQRFSVGDPDSRVNRYPGNRQPVGPSGPGRPDSVASPGYVLSPNDIVHSQKGNSGVCIGGAFVHSSPGKVSSEISVSGSGSCVSSAPVGFGMGPGHMSPLNAGMMPVGGEQILGRRLTHFDPITSMAQMSQSLSASNGIQSNHQPHLNHHPSVADNGSVNVPHNIMSGIDSMNMANMQISGNGVVPGANHGNMPQIVNFQAGMHGGSHHQQQQQQQLLMGEHGIGSMQQQHHHNQDMISHVGQNIGPLPGNNTFVSSAMSAQQLNIQSETTTAYNPALHGLPINSQVPMRVSPVQQGGISTAVGANTVSSSVTMNPIVHSAISPKSSNTMLATQHPPTQQSQQKMYPQGVTQQQLSGGAMSVTHLQGAMSIGPRGPQHRTSMPFNGANVQVKASAPNTIQYMPAKPLNPANAPHRRPSLEFLQRFTGSMTNMENKGNTNPPYNVQYFQQQPQHSVQQSHHGGSSQNQEMCLGMNQMNAGVDRNVSCGMNPARNAEIVGSHGQYMVRGHNPAILRPNGDQQHLPPHQQMMMNSGYGMFPSAASEQSVYGNQMMTVGEVGPNGSGGTMYGPKGHMQTLGMDSMQPLLPSISNQSGTSFKQSPFLGPTTADPNYAQQFHNFQQQLYATNTRGGQQINNQSAMPQGQTFFGAKVILDDIKGNRLIIGFQLHGQYP